MLTACLTLAGVGAAAVGPASASSGSSALSTDTGGYPYWDMPCVWSPYSTSGTGYWCRDYAWGTIQNNEGSKSVIDPTYGYAYRNCTDYAAWKLSTLGVPSSRYDDMGNANTWGSNAPNHGVTVNSTPAIGSIAIDPSGQFGHVAFVAGVYGSTIMVTQYNQAMDGNYSVQTGTPAELGFSQFAHYEVFEPKLPPPVRVTTTALGGLVAGHFISTSVNASGGSPPYAFALTSGRLPSGLAFDSSGGRISGTPVAPGSWSFLVTVTDSAGRRASKSISAHVAPGIEDLFVRAGNGTAWHDFVTGGGTWSGWGSLGAPPGVSLVSDVTVGIGSGGREYAFGRSSNGAVWSDHYNGQRWAGWSNLGSPHGLAVLSDATTGTTPAGLFEIFVRAGNSVWHDVAGSSGWSGWTDLGGPRGTTIGSNLTVGTDPSGDEDIFGRGANGSIYREYRTARGAWSGWQDLGGARHTTIVTDVTVGYDRIGTEELFARASDGAIWHDYLASNGSWSGWSSMGAPAGVVLGYALTVGVNANGGEELFARSTTGSTWHRWVTSKGGWSPWSGLGSAKQSPLVSNLTIAYNRYGNEELSARSSNGLIMHDWYSPKSGWSGWEVLGSLRGTSAASNIGDVAEGVEP